MKHVFYPRVEISETTMNNLLERFPYLEKRWVEALFKVGKLNSRIVELSDDYKNNKSTFHIAREWYLTLPENVSEKYSLPREIELVTDEKGFICKIYKNKEELSMLKQYAGFDTSVLQEGLAVELTFPTSLFRSEKVANFLVVRCSETDLKLIDSTGEVLNITPQEVKDEQVFIRILN